MIGVYEPEIGPEEIAAVVDALERGEISGSFGAALHEFESAFAAFCGVSEGVAVTSGTTALHLAMTALDLSPGDEVLMSASTNVATALAAYHNGLVCVPVDSEPRTWNLDLELIEGLISPRTRAIIPVHLFGHPVDMERLIDLADRHELAVVEDCAEAHGATCRGRRVGSFGDMSCFSFYANKVITTGEGGMVVTDNDALAERLRSLRNLAFGTPRFKHEEAGFNFRMTNYQAAMGCAQLTKIDSTIERKRRVAELYTERLAGVPWLQLPPEEEWARSVYWMYAVVVADDAPVTRDGLGEILASKGIDTRTFFCPIGQQPFLQRSGALRDTPCPVADRLWSSGMYLPSSLSLTIDEIDLITNVIRRSEDHGG